VANCALHISLVNCRSRRLQPISRFPTVSAPRHRFGIRWSLTGPLVREFGKVSVNVAALDEALFGTSDARGAIQTVLRVEGVRALREIESTHARPHLTLDDFATFIDGLEVPPKIKERPQKLRAQNYSPLCAACKDQV